MAEQFLQFNSSGSTFFMKFLLSVFVGFIFFCEHIGVFDQQEKKTILKMRITCMYNLHCISLFISFLTLETWQFSFSSNVDGIFRFCWNKFQFFTKDSIFFFKLKNDVQTAGTDWDSNSWTKHGHIRYALLHHRCYFSLKWKLSCFCEFQFLLPLDYSHKIAIFSLSQS